MNWLDKLIKRLPHLAAAIAAIATMVAYGSGFFSGRVYAALTDKDGKKVYATRGEHERTQEQISKLDAGTAKKEDVAEVKQAVKDLDAKFDKKFDEQNKMLIRILQKK